MFGALKSAFKALKDKIVKPVDVVEDKTQSTQQSDSQNSTEISKLGSVNEIKEDITEVIKQPPIDISVVDNNVEELISEKQDLVKNEPLAESLIEQELNLPELKKEDKIIVEEKKEQKISTLTKIKSVFSSKYYLSESDLNAVSENLEMSFLQADLSIDVSEKLIDNLITKIKKEGLPKEDSLDLSVKEVFIDVINSLITKKYNESFFTNQDKKPYVIMFVGTNGTGKTTSIAKLAHYLKSKGKKIVLSASDTYRAASIEQLSGHAEKIGVDIVKGKYGQDPASVAFDAIAFAKSKAYDYVLIDTAGRQDTNEGLMKELGKIKKVANPDLTVFVSEALAGQSALIQARKFLEITEFDAFALTKVDVDEKGGTLLSIAIGLDKPILFLGIGQEYEDITLFNLDFIKKMLE